MGRWNRVLKLAVERGFDVCGGFKGVLILCAFNVCFCSRVGVGRLKGCVALGRAWGWLGCAWSSVAFVY